MKPEVVSATDAARGLGDLLARVRYRQESFLIRRGRVVVARLGPVGAPSVTGAAAAKAWQEIPRLGARDAKAFEQELAAARRVLKRPRDPWDS